MGNTQEKGLVESSKRTNEVKDFSQNQELLRVIEENHRKDTIKMYIFFVFVFLAFLAVIGISLVFIDGSFISELRSGNTSLMKNTDYLELVLPILLAIVAAFIAFLGINRLKDMDAQVNQMRNSISTELDKEIKRVASLRSDLAEHIDVAVSTKTQTFAVEMEGKLESVSQDGEKKVTERKEHALIEIDESKKEFIALADQAKEKLESFDQRYSWLLSNEYTAKNVFVKEVASVYDVHQIVEAMWNSDNKPDNIAELTKRYVEKVITKTSDLRGDENDYHNLAAECARHSLYGMACKICEAGLVFFPQNIDLLSDWIQYGTATGNIDAAVIEPLNRLLAIDKTHWNWRAFNFTVNYYIAAGMFEEAENLADDFVLYCPYEERAYYCQAEVYQKRYAKEEGIQKTIIALQTAMDKNINCPLCANKLADVLSDCGRLDEALVAANRAIQELAQEQPSVNYGYVIYRRALILDRMAYKAQADRLDAHDIAVKAAIDYKMAINSRLLSPITSRQATVRYDMLKNYFKIEADELGENDFDASSSVDDLIEALKEMTNEADS